MLQDHISTLNILTDEEFGIILKAMGGAKEELNWCCNSIISLQCSHRSIISTNLIALNSKVLLLEKSLDDKEKEIEAMKKQHKADNDTLMDRIENTPVISELAKSLFADILQNGVESHKGAKLLYASLFTFTLCSWGTVLFAI